jgi:hypothetical protein
MRTPIIVRRGSIELLTNQPLKRVPKKPEEPEPPFEYRLPGWHGRACVDAFEVSTGRLTVRDDYDQGERELHIWPVGTPSGTAPFQVRISSKVDPKGFTVTTAAPLTEVERSRGRQHRYVYEVSASQFSYDLYVDDDVTIEGRNLDDAAFVLGLKHWLEVDLSDPFMKYLVLGAGAGLLGALLARELAPRRDRRGE